MLLVFCVHAAGNAAAVAWGIDFGGARFASLHAAVERIVFWLYRSHHGVFLFFVLSGFLIGRMFARQRKGDGPRAPPAYARFAWRRILRIYPAFLLAFAASLAFCLHDGTWTPPDWPRVAGNLLFLNGAPGVGVAPFNIVTWSLFYEMTFYLAVPLVARGGEAAMWTGVALPAALAALGADPLVLCWSLLFAGAMLARHEEALRAAMSRVPSAWPLAAYLVVTTAAMLDALPPEVAILAFGAASVALVAKALEPGNAVSRGLSLRPLRALGRVSYSFYLLHWMIVVLVARAAAAAWPGPRAAIAIFVAGFVLSLVAACASWWIAERPYYGRHRER